MVAMVCTAGKQVEVNLGARRPPLASLVLSIFEASAISLCNKYKRCSELCFHGGSQLTHGITA